MRFQYAGYKKIKGEDGIIIRTFSPCAEITYSQADAEIVYRMLEESGRHFDLLGFGNVMLAQVSVGNGADYISFTQECRAFLFRQNHKIGDIVYVIIKDKNFLPAVRRVAIDHMDKETLRVEEPNQYNGVAYDTWTFPWTALRREVYTSKQAACRALNKRRRKQM